MILTSEHRSMSGPIAEVIEAASRHFDANDRHEVEQLTLFYEDRARQLVKQHLHGLGLGVANDPNPVDSGLLGFVVRQLAVAYRSPPTRWLTRDGTRLDDLDPAQVAMTRVYAGAAVDATLRHVDELRSLWRTCFVRVYASDRARRVKLVPFSPRDVYREVSPGEEGDPRADTRIALRRGDGSFELWTQAPDGYTLTLYSSRGEQLSQPEPYDVLPVVAFYDGLPIRPYLRPPQSRVSYLFKIAACANEVIAAVKWDVHPRAVFEVEPGDATKGYEPPGPADLPRDTGPGVGLALPPGASFRLEQVQPQIQAISEASKGLVESWFRAESLPTDSFRQSQNVSALGLQTLAQPLRERRESLLPFVLETEQQLFEVIRAMHNPHADVWGSPMIDESAGLHVTLGDIDIPVDPAAHSEQIARDIALKLSSRIDGIMRRYSVNRPEAIERAVQVDSDNINFPPGRIPEIERRLSLAESDNPNASTTAAAAEAMEPTP